MKKLLLGCLMLVVACSSNEEEIIEQPVVTTVGTRPLSGQVGDPSDGIILVGSYLSRQIRFRDTGFDIATNPALDNAVRLRRLSGGDTAAVRIEFTFLYENLQTGTEYYYRAFTEDLDGTFYYGEIKSFSFF